MEPGVVVSADRAALRGMLVNLIDNGAPPRRAGEVALRAEDGRGRGGGGRRRARRRPARTASGSSTASTGPPGGAAPGRRPGPADRPRDRRAVGRHPEALPAGDGARFEVRLPLGDERPSASASPAFSRTSSPTRAGSARPPVAFIAWPTKNPTTLSLPSRSCSAWAGLSASSRSTRATSSPSSEIWPRPLLLHHGPRARRRCAMTSAEHLLGERGRQGAVVDQADQLGQALGGDPALPRLLAQLAQLGAQLAAHPVGRRLGVDPRRRPPRSRPPAPASRRAPRRPRSVRPRSRAQRRRRSAGSSGSSARSSSTQARSGTTRHQVRLGEVPVVVGLLLAAQGVDLAGVGVEVEGLLASPRRRPPGCAIWRAISASMPRSRKRKLFMFFSSVLVPSPVAPAGRTLTLASARMRALLHVAVAHARGGAGWCAAGAGRRRPAAEVRKSGSVTISSSGVPPRLKSTPELSAPARRPSAPAWTSLAASSSRWARVIPTVNSPSGRQHADAPAHADGLVVLGDLVRLREVRIEVVLAVELRVRGDLAARAPAPRGSPAGSPRG